tara:strand:+ start:5836 stop:7062 length:1227 start_codon:yes stop_codon:yes gene_type:complete
MQFRPYQQEIIQKGSEIIARYSFLYLAMEVRTGKTLTSFGIAQAIKVSSVLFVTKKKAISSIEKDYEILQPSFNIQIINYESLHKIEGKYDLIIFDEAHGMGAFPKPSKRAKQAKLLVMQNKCYVILLSGTPTPESYSQMYHQVFFCTNNPFGMYKNFYRFADDYVEVVERKFNSMPVRDYSGGHISIIEKMKPFTITYTQKEAGFLVENKEQVLLVDIDPKTLNMIRQLKKDLVIQGKTEDILADTAVKLMSKVHQLCSGTVKFESGNSMVLDYSKANYIKKYFAKKKIGIFYKFKEELSALKEVFKDNVCTTLEEFDSTNKNIALQIQSGREGISLKNAEALVYYNIDFSATSYWQSRDRMTTKDRRKNNIYWVFSRKGIESQIYKTVTNKKDYTLSHFKSDIKRI